MKKKTAVIALMVLAYFLSVSSAWAAELKYATINVPKLLNGYEKTKEQERQLQEAGNKKEKERDALVQSLRQMKDELALLNDDARAKKQEQLDMKIRELQDFDVQAKQMLGEKKNGALKEILTDIDGTVKKYGERKGLDFIFSEQALLYYQPQYDVTNDILTELNKTYPQKKA